MVDEDRDDDDPLKYVEWAVRPPEVIPPDPPVEWTRRHERTLSDNLDDFGRYAELLRDGEIHGAIQIRTESLELNGTKYQRVRSDQLPDTYLVALERRVQELRKDGWNVVEIGDRRKVDGLSLRTLNRRRTDAKERGLGA